MGQSSMWGHLAP